MSKADPFSGRSVLVVGGAGFVGSNLVQMLLSADVRSLTIVDNFLSSERSNVPNDCRLTLIQGSIADDSVLNRLPEDLDYVWHLACYHGNQSSIHDPIADHDNNTITSLKLFQALSRRANLTKVVYSAAGCAVAEKTFDAPAATPEDAPVSLFHDSPYSISKLIGEMYGNYFFRRNGLPFVKARFQNVYGPGEILGAGSWRGTPATVWRNVTPTFIWRALHKEPLPLENKGETGRDFIYVDDICRGLIACAVHGRAGEAYNLATGTEILIREWADLINELTNNSTPVDLLPARTWDTSGRRYGSTEKSRNELGFSAKVAYREGLAETVAWTKRHQELIRRNVDKHHAEMAQYAAVQASNRI